MKHSHIFVVSFCSKLMAFLLTLRIILTIVVYIWQSFKKSTMFSSLFFNCPAHGQFNFKQSLCSPKTWLAIFVMSCNRRSIFSFPVISCSYLLKAASNNSSRIFKPWCHNLYRGLHLKYLCIHCYHYLLLKRYISVHIFLHWTLF